MVQWFRRLASNAAGVDSVFSQGTKFPHPAQQGQIIKVNKKITNGNTDVENGLMDTVGKGESGKNGESSIDVYTLLCVKQTVGEMTMLMFSCV